MRTPRSRIEDFVARSAGVKSKPTLKKIFRENLGGKKSEQGGTLFFPLCMEASSLLGKSGKELFTTIARHADAMDNGMSLEYVYNLLIIAAGTAVQKGPPHHGVVPQCCGSTLSLIHI